MGQQRYLFKRKGSANWYVRLQPPGQKLIERSLGTTDQRAAEIAAADLIRDHKAFMFQRRQSRVASIVHGPWAPEYPAGLHTLPDGRTLIATERDLTFADGTRRPNGGPAIYLTGEQLPAAQEFQAFDAAYAGVIGEGPIRDGRPKLVAVSSDDTVLETYIKHNGIDGLREKQARDTWHIFRTVVRKPLRSCTRDDGRAIVEYMKAQADEPPKSATLRRRMVPLVAAVNLAISEGKLTFNPFSACVPIVDDEAERDAFDESDMKLARENLHQLSASDQLLVRLVATTGMRRSEAFAIDREEIEDGIRFVTIGHKTGASVRRVPFPADLLPFLPAKITGQLIVGSPGAASGRLAAWMSNIGIAGVGRDDEDTNKAPMHSFRHRAAQRLRAAVPDEALREAIGGWAGGSRKKQSRKYGNKHGRGFPLAMLKSAIDAIGF